MADKILTLCDSCAALMQSGGFEVLQTSSWSVRLPLRGRKCENCGQKTFVVLHQYALGGKRGGNG